MPPIVPKPKPVKVVRKRTTKKTSLAIDEPDSLYQIWTCYINIGKMLKNRGCIPSEVEELTDVDFDTFKKEVEDNDMVVPSFSVENERRKYLSHVIIYPLDQVVKKNVLVNIEEMLSAELPEDYVHNIIFIGTEKSTSKIKKILNDKPFSKEYGKIIYESLSLAFFYDDKVSNVICDPMRELSQEEVEDLKYNDSGFDPKNLPILLTSDPMCMYYGFPTGTIVEVIRTDDVFVQMTAYRIVQTIRQVTARNH
jgi:DNA-directed RNA polymerase subunit H (RpoH/RPB5)